MPRTTLGREIHRLRSGSGLTLRTFARRVHSSATHLCDIENGRRTPSDELLRRIAECTRAPYEELRLLKPVVERDLERWYAESIEVRRLMREARSHSLSPREMLIRLRAAGKDSQSD
jgi:transcriptional regulator with XRE-family HTH domain